MVKKGNIPWNKGLTKETDKSGKLRVISEKNKKSNLGKRLTKETKRKMSISAKKTPRTWLKNRKFSSEHKQHISESMLRIYVEGKIDTKARNRRISLSNKGKIRTEEVKKKISVAIKNKYENNPEYKLTISSALTGRERPKEVSRRAGETLRKRLAKLSDKERREWAMHGLKGKKPTLFERRLLRLIDEYKLPFEYVGNGQLWINQKNPDFISLDKTQIIEVFYTYHKSNTYAEERRKFFPNHRVIFLDEHDLFGRGWRERCLAKILNQDLETEDKEIVCFH